MKKLFLILLLVPFFSIAQNINGIVVSQKTNLPIEDTNVFTLSNNFRTLTNEKGEFTLESVSKFKDNDIVEFSHIGYLTLKISWEDLKKANFRISLLEAVENLAELTITANHELKLKSKLNFNKLSPLKNAISSFGSCIKDDKIYIIGGNTSSESNVIEKLKAKNINSDDPNFLQKYLNELRFQFNGGTYKGDLLIYDIKADKWETSALKFKKRAFNNLNYYNNTMYVLGGKRISANQKFEYLEDEIEVFDLDKQTIIIDKTYPHKASNAASFTYKDNIIVMGGSVKATEKGASEFSNKVHLYNITSGYWYVLADMPIAKETSGILVNDKIYLVGGNNPKPLADIESFDLNTEKWQTEGELFSGLEKPTVASNNDLIYIFENRKMLVYDTKSKVLKEFLVELNLKFSAMYFFDNKLYIVGGNTFIDYTSSSSANVYSIAIDEFETTKPNQTKTFSQGLNFAKATQ